MLSPFTMLNCCRFDLNIAQRAEIREHIKCKTYHELADFDSNTDIIKSNQSIHTNLYVDPDIPEGILSALSLVNYSAISSIPFTFESVTDVKAQDQRGGLRGLLDIARSPGLNPQDEIANQLSMIVFQQLTGDSTWREIPRDVFTQIRI